MNRREALLDAEARYAGVDVFGTLRWRRFDFVGGVRIRSFQLCAMHFRLPLQVRIFVHLVGPDRGVQLEAAGDGDDFLAVGYAAGSGDARDGDAFGFAEVGVGQFCTARRACRRCHSEGRGVCVPKNLNVGCTSAVARLRSFAVAQDDIR
jgi:hypothetical protein